MIQHHKIPLMFTTLFILSFSSIARYNITPTNPLLDHETLVSVSGSFALGFFNPNPKNRYIGLWYNNIPENTTAMVVNRANPLVNSPGVLSITSDGSLTVTDKDSRVVWSSNTSTKLINPIAQLLDNGNLIVKENLEDGLYYAWQSFDHPTDTLLAGMKLGVDFTTGLNRTLTSWSSSIDPTPGAYQLYMETKGDPEVFLVKGANRIWRSGPWDGAHLSGVPYMLKYQGFNYSFVNNKSGVTLSYQLEPSIISRVFVTSSGLYQRMRWMEDRNQWNYYWSMPESACDQIGTCGNNCLCDKSSTPLCSCLTGFERRNNANWIDGCVKKHELDCVNGTDGFVVVSNVKLPQSEYCEVILSLSLDQCESLCLRNCSCTAYASAIAATNSGCVIWIGDLFDIQSYERLHGQDLYVRLNAFDVPKGSPGFKSHGRLFVGSTVVAGILISTSVGCVLCIRRKKKGKRKLILGAMNRPSSKVEHGQNDESIDIPIFCFDTIMRATKNFSSDSKIGEGGFGHVYKGKLEDGQEIAVKRLWGTSSQGSEELKNELMLIAKLQHRNLVRLLGCCIQGEERMLIYEYLHNHSLDVSLFDKEKRSLLDWSVRYQIIIGIARGLLYLHQDSRFRIIHRDLKAGNVLLDKDMNPKISDFGLAIIVSGDETGLNTRKIVGTYGYMSPECAMDGAFSVKSDVFSFGVLVLEIISGKKSRGVYGTLPYNSLLSHAWRLWEEGNVLQLVDDSMNDTFSNDEVLRCIKIGLLCIEEHPADRPPISSIVEMFDSDIKIIPQPKKPGFLVRKCDSSGYQNTCSNELSITMFEPR